MKKYFVFLFVFISLVASAKKVKFQVNLQGQAVDTSGIHITGDFQTEAGFAADWDPGTTAMIQDVNDTNIWYVVVDIPAFAKYEFKFVNGIYGYQQEFVPLESRVNYNFIDSRWIYVDSMANDTQDVAAVRFAGNAPAGKNLIRFYVDMTLQTVNPAGTHVATTMNAWSTTDAHMYSFDGSTWEYISYADSGQSTAREFKFLNGNGAGDFEILAGWCDNANTNREVIAPRDTMLPVVCYSFCAACTTVGQNELATHNFSVSPNPATDNIQLGFGNNEQRIISIVDQLGREVYYSTTGGAASVAISTVGFSRGAYFVRVMENSGSVTVQKIIVQ